MNSFVNFFHEGLPVNKPVSVPTIETVETLYTQVSREGFGVTDFVSSIPTKFSELSASVKDFSLSVLKSGFSDTGRSNPYQLSRILDRTNYLTLSPVEIFVPPGLSVPLLDYAETLNAHSDVLMDVLNKVLLPGIRWANGYLREPSRLASVRDFYTESGMVKFDVKKAKEDIGRCLMGNLASDRLPFGDVAKNFKDYVSAAKLIGELVIKTEATNNKTIIEKVEVLAGVIDTLNDKVQLGDERFRFPPAIMQQLADTIYHVAETVELYAGLVTYIRVAANSVKDSEARLDEILKN